MSASLPDAVTPIGRAGGQLPILDFAGDALFLDIDGTLIDIAPTPDSVLIPESLKVNLARVREKLSGALALLSGRALAAVDHLFAPLKFAAAGAHAAEVRFTPDGDAVHCAAPLTAADKAVFADIAKMDSRLRIEDKVYALAIHYRGVPELANEIVRQVNARTQSQENLQVMHGKAVVEVKRPGFNKGTGLRALMLHPPFESRRPLYFGDDTTDEDALAVLPDFGGVGFSVGRLLPGATGMLKNPAELQHWLAALADAV